MTSNFSEASIQQGVSNNMDFDDNEEPTRHETTSVATAAAAATTSSSIVRFEEQVDEEVKDEESAPPSVFMPEMVHSDADASNAEEHDVVVSSTRRNAPLTIQNVDNYVKDSYHILREQQRVGTTTPGDHIMATTGHTPVVATFEDHFSLAVPTSKIRYRGLTQVPDGGAPTNTGQEDAATTVGGSGPGPSASTRTKMINYGAARVVECDDVQIVLEETSSGNVSIRQIYNSSEGARALRILYAIVLAFFTGFLFVVCLQILLYLCYDVAVQVGATSQQTKPKYGPAIGVIFAIIPFVYGLASALVIAGAFIADTWKGHVLIRNFAFRKLKTVHVEWIFFAFFLGLPLLLMGATLLSGTDDWWIITGLFWLACIILFYILFAISVMYYEMNACLEVSRNQYNDNDESFWHVITRAILLRQRSSYSGLKTVTYLSLGAVADSEETDKGGESNMVEGTRREYMAWRARFTLWLANDGNSNSSNSCIDRYCGCCRSGMMKMYESIEEDPMRVYSIDDARDNRPFITTHSWSLEKIFCRPRNSRYVAIIKGPGAITSAQMKSSVVCSLIGSFLIFFLILGALVYLELGAVFTCFILAAGVLVAFPSLKMTYDLYRTGEEYIFGKNRSAIMKRLLRYSGQSENIAESANNSSQMPRRDTYTEASEEFNSAESTAAYLVSKSYRITKPNDKFCWIMFAVEVCVLFIWPLLSLFAIGNWQLGILFLVATAITLSRYYINVAVVLEEAGHMDLCDGKTKREKWKNQSTLDEIIGNITRGRSKEAWMAVLGVVGFCFLALAIGAIGTSQASQASDETTPIYLPDFQYLQRDSLQYPTCQLTSDLGDSPIKTMADFAYLAGLAYRKVDLTQSELDAWFGAGVAVDNNEYVEQFRNSTESVVSFKFITFPQSGNFSIVSIRGTTNAYDALTDAQLWSSAALLQVLRFILPLGGIWTPIMDRLIAAISSLDSYTLDKVSFYKDTTRFVNKILESVPRVFRGVALTGHSLGGGLAMISGAQTGVPAVALSGPNAMLSRLSFNPPLTKEALNSKTFNIIPERDVVPMIDDRALNFQEIRCTTSTVDVIGCHFAFRSLCEIMYTCGTRNRPAICECVTQFDYPEPEPKPGTNITFKEACNL